MVLGTNNSQMKSQTWKENGKILHASFFPNGELGIKFNFKMIHTKGWLWCDKYYSIKQLTGPIYSGTCTTWMYFRPVLHICIVIIKYHTKYLSYPCNQSPQNMYFLPVMLDMFSKMSGIFPEMLCKGARFLLSHKCVQMHKNQWNDPPNKIWWSFSLFIHVYEICF